MRSNYEVKLCARKSRDEVIWYTMNCSLQETMVWIHNVLFLAIKHLISNHSGIVHLIHWNIESILLLQWDRNTSPVLMNKCYIIFKFQMTKNFSKIILKVKFYFAWSRKEKLHVLCITNRLGNGIYYKHL